MHVCELVIVSAFTLMASALSYIKFIGVPASKVGVMVGVRLCRRGEALCVR
jgi:hypothetical protein